MTTREPVASTPTPDGEFVWRVTFSSRISTVDGPSDIGSQTYVLGRNRTDAITKARPILMQKVVEAQGPLTAQAEANAQLTAEVVMLEDLVVAAWPSDQSRSGGIVVRTLREISLGVREDNRRYRLGVCLVPVE